MNQIPILPSDYARKASLKGRDPEQPPAKLPGLPAGGWFSLVGNSSMTWLKIETAPYERDIEVAVMESDGPHAVAFPCRRVLGGWIKATTGSSVNIHPTHWREWSNTTPLSPTRH